MAITTAKSPRGGSERGFWLRGSMQLVNPNGLVVRIFAYEPLGSTLLEF